MLSGTIVRKIKLLEKVLSSHRDDKIARFHLSSVACLNLWCPWTFSYVLCLLLQWQLKDKQGALKIEALLRLLSDGAAGTTMWTHRLFPYHDHCVWALSGPRFRHTLTCKSYKEKTLSWHKRNRMKHPVMRGTIWGGELHRSAQKMCWRVYGFWGCRGNSSNPSLK